jgi:hypothetical protein
MPSLRTLAWFPFCVTDAYVVPLYVYEPGAVTVAYRLKMSVE